jgi:hypothetical protein
LLRALVGACAPFSTPYPPLNTLNGQQTWEKILDAKQAVRQAKAYLSELLAEESPSNLGLEEIEFDEASEDWLVTLGFSRPWNTVRNAMTAIAGDPSPRRAYRVVRIKNADGRVLSIKRRDKDGAD